MVRVNVGVASDVAATLPRSGSSSDDHVLAAAGDEQEVASLDLGTAGIVELLDQGFESEGTHWYSTDIDATRVESTVAALLAYPGVDSAYVPIDEPPSA